MYDNTLSRWLQPPQAAVTDLMPLLLACAALLGGCHETAAQASPPPLSVAAAADLHYAFTALGKRFEAAHHQPIRFTFGSTGLMTRQLIEGAPYDLFAAADRSFAQRTISAGVCARDSEQLYAQGRLVLWTQHPKGRGTLRTLADLRHPGWRKIAIANPEHAPYGRAAQAALQKVGLWQRLKPRIVYGENVRQTLQFAASGNADVAIIALSLAVATPKGRFARVPANAHPRIAQSLVRCPGGKAPAAARAFVDLLNSDEGQATMHRFGFVRP
ncbi:MAG: molybdate ABC transporter substrate-binding protein, partial [Polyangiales bacterium]